MCKWACELEFEFENEPTNILIECDTLKDAYKASCSMARKHMFKYDEPSNVYVFKLGDYHNTKKLVFTASWFGPINW